MSAPAGRVPVALTIAGSDSGGGAGIQADLKAFARCGVHGTSALTALTAQNTTAVRAIHQVPGRFVVEQVLAVAQDLGVDAVKVGMLADAATVEAVAIALDELPRHVPVVVDPVMVAESGGRLLASSAERALVELILPRADVLTPNLPEARVLAGVTAEGPGDEAEALALAHAIMALGPGAVLLTGGHRATAVDLLLHGDPPMPVWIEGPRHPDGSAHGSGCTHSSVLAAMLARGADLEQAARVARQLAGEAVGNGLRGLGHGPGPVDVLGLGRLGSELPGAVD